MLDPKLNYVEIIQRFIAQNPKDEEGELYNIKPLPGIGDSAINNIQLLANISLNDDVKSLLMTIGGLENGPMEFIDFSLREKSSAYTWGRPNNFRSIASDGFGNEWFVDLDSLSPMVGPIYYYQHEGPMFFYQSENLFAFIDEYIKFALPPRKSLIDDVHEFRITPIKRLNDSLKLVSENPSILRELSHLSMGEKTLLYRDFNNAKPGDGIDLKGYRLIEILSRQKAFVVEKKIGLFSRLFGRT